MSSDLPSEIWTEIFKFNEADSLALELPLTCKLFSHLTSSNELWRIKCMQRGLDLTLKKPAESYKEFYYFQHLELFPLFGIEIGKTTAKELEAIAKVEPNASRYSTINGVNFWFNNNENIFKMMYLVKNIYIMPKEWEAQGLHYEHSWNSLLIYLREYNHNYQIQRVPSQEPFQNRDCFSALVQTICKCKNLYFSIMFTFAYAPGKADSKGTLYSISVNTSSSTIQENEWKGYYENNVFITKDYVIENENQVREKLAKELLKIAPKLVRKMKIIKPKPKIISLVMVDGIQIPNDIWHIIFHHSDGKTLAINVPQVCSSLYALSSDERLWEEKCKQLGKDLNGRYEDEPWKRYYFAKVLDLFPLFGCVIEQTKSKELLERADGKKAAQDQYVTINGVNFWFNNTEEVFRMMYIVRGIYPIPTQWLDLGITFEKSYEKYLNFFKAKLGNYQVTSAPTQKNHSFMPQTSFDASVSVVGRHKDIYYLMTFVFGFAPGNTHTSNTLYSISLRGPYNPGETAAWKINFEEKVIIDMDPIEDPEEPKTNPDYGKEEPPMEDVDTDEDLGGLFD